MFAQIRSHAETLLAQSAETPIPDSPQIELSSAAAAIQGAIIISGIVLLLTIVVLWFLRPGKFSLAMAPGRPNRLTITHCILLALVMEVMSLFFAWPLGGSFQSRETLLLAWAGSRIPMLALIPFVASRTFVNGAVNGMGLSMRRWPHDSLCAIIAVLAIYPVCILLSHLSLVFLSPERTMLHPILSLLISQDISTQWKLFAVFAAVILAPLVEEMLFRGILQSYFRRILPKIPLLLAGAGFTVSQRSAKFWTSPWPAITLISLIFAAIHINFFEMRGFENFLPLLALSLALGYAYERFGHLWPSILMHILFNAINILLVLISP